jgi:aryl sulfotransferase
MKANAPRIAPGGGAFFANGGATFFGAGSNGRWRDELTKDDIRHYEAMVVSELGSECAHWLATGEMPD